MTDALILHLPKHTPERRRPQTLIFQFASTRAFNLGYAFPFLIRIFQKTRQRLFSYFSQALSQCHFHSPYFDLGLAFLCNPLFNNLCQFFRYSVYLFNVYFLLSLG